MIFGVQAACTCLPPANGLNLWYHSTFYDWQTLLPHQRAIFLYSPLQGAYNIVITLQIRTNQITIEHNGIAVEHRGAFSNSRSFASIDNVCLIVSELLNRDIPGGAYNIADDNPLSTNALIEIICGVMGKKCRIWNVSPGLIGLLAKVGNVLHLPLNTQRLAKLTESYVVSNQKIKKALGVDQLPIDSKAGLEKTIRSFIKH